jgi:hypothetical protein
MPVFIPQGLRAKPALRIEFKTFINALVAIPCQIVKQARRIVYRVLAYNPHQTLFFRLLDTLRC